MSFREKVAATGMLTKGFAVAGVLIVGILAINYFQGEVEQPLLSSVPTGPTTIESIPGMVAPTPEQEKNLAIDDQRRLTVARENGDSAFPTVRLDAMAQEPARDIPDEAVQAVIAPEPVAQPVIPRPVAPPTQPFVPKPAQEDRTPAISAAMLDGMKQPTVQIAPAEVVTVSPGITTATAVEAPARPSVLSAYTAPVSVKRRGPSAGTLVYAQMISGANSDAPGPVVAQIVQGEYAGAKIIGGFQAGRDSLVVEFKALSYERESFGSKKTETVPISAFAVDSKTVESGVATSVDRHVLANTAFAFAAAFAEGFSDAVQDSGNNVAISDSGLFIGGSDLSLEDQLLAAGGKSIGAAGRNLDRLFGGRQPTIKIASGTPIGVLFIPTGSDNER